MQIHSNYGFFLQPDLNDRNNSYRPDLSSDRSGSEISFQHPNQKKHILNIKILCGFKKSTENKKCEIKLLTVENNTAKVVHFRPESLVHFAPELVVHFRPEQVVHFDRNHQTNHLSNYFLLSYAFYGFTTGLPSCFH